MAQANEFAEEWPDVDQIGQQPVGQLPRSTNALLTKLKKRDRRGVDLDQTAANVAEIRGSRT
jgi:hypothetical protein